MIFVDTNVLIDLNQPGSAWHGWSMDQIVVQRAHIVVNHIVVAELAPSYDDVSLELGLLDGLGIKILPLTDAAAFRAGQAHARYREAGGDRQGVLADFLIGGHAATLAAKLLTRDRQRFAAYFPELTLITPETHP